MACSNLIEKTNMPVTSVLLNKQLQIIGYSMLKLGLTFFPVQLTVPVPNITADGFGNSVVGIGIGLSPSFSEMRKICLDCLGIHGNTAIN